ncbi:MAG: translation initiation factor IF-2 [Gemmatimonadota bacterium]|nr:translation initiation factor IF-2 [Gemmatimonadota bacterium]
MAKVRVYEVARRFDVSSAAMVNLLEEMGVDVKNHMSSIDEETIARVEAKFEAEKEAVKQAEEEKKKKREEARRKRRERARAEREAERAEAEAGEAGEEEEEEAEEEEPAEVRETEEEEKEGKPRRRRRRRKVSRKRSEKNIKETLAKIEAETRGEEAVEEAVAEPAPEPETAPRAETEPENLIKVTEFVSVGELADLIDVAANEIISTCMQLGLMVTINQRLDFDTISLICEEFGYTAQKEEAFVIEEREDTVEVSEEDLEPRSPIVTVMGHVDHGKTSLLDHVRETNVIAGESGGITQHIGAYEVELDDGRGITFLDTPGHEAFTAMRARGAQVTDIVILVVAADDGVMPQTTEAIDHAQAAGVPIVVAVNKIDLPNARTDRVKQELMQHNLVIEEYGGEVLAAEVSAETGEGVEELLEKVMLQAELLDLKADPDRDARGVVIEAELDKGMGPVATVLGTAGTLEGGDPFIVGLYDGKVRAMRDERGNNVETAGPSTPVRVLGLNGVPEAGDTFAVIRDESEVRDIAEKRQDLQREQGFRRVKEPTTLEELYEQVEAGQVERLNVILKGDVGGSVEALADELSGLSTEEVEVDVIHRGVGAISENDVLLAAASDAIVIGFHVRPDSRARRAAEREAIDVRHYDVIYEAVDDVRRAMEGLLEPEEREVVLGSAEVRETFRISGVGTIAGCYVADGTIPRTARVRVTRDGVDVYEGPIGSLKRFKEDVREVREGYECGINVEGFNDVKIGDAIEAYKIEEVQRTLA